MADPIKTIVDAERGAMPAQGDPAHFEWWMKYHQTEADKIAANGEGESQADRTGEVMSEMDHRAAAAGFHEQIQQLKDKDYSNKLRAELQSRGVLPAPTDKTPREHVLEDTRKAFEDLEIPVDLAEHAVFVADLENVPDPADRERFYNNVLDVKSSLNELASNGGDSEEIEGINDWKSALAMAATQFERRQANEKARQAQPAKIDLATAEAAVDAAQRAQWKAIIGAAIKGPSTVEKSKASPQETQKEVKDGLLQARAHWAMSSEQLREKYPLLRSEQDSRKVMQAGARRAWLASQLPDSWRGRLGINTEAIYNNGMERAYQKFVDKQADLLLKQRTKALENLRGVNTTTPTHLLPSKQYRAAENLVRIDQELRRLRPLPSEQLGAAVSSARAEASPQTVVAQAAVQQQTASARAAEKPIPTPAVATKHDEALKAVREIRAQVPVDGYRSKAADAMANRIVQQLQEGRSTVQLSTRYAGGDQGQANATHRNAVEANADLIEAVRSRGIAVDTGAASVALGKKSEVDLAPQAELDQSLG